MPSIPEQIAQARDRIARAAVRAERAPADVTLMAVTKRVPPERIAEAVSAGVRDLGENYYQEARDKLPLFDSTVRWHFIGHLQSNKARYVAGQFALVQSVDTPELAQELGRRATAQGIVQPILLEVQIDPAETKHGVLPDVALEVAHEILTIPGIRLDGLMGMAPYGAAPEAARPSFRTLRRLFDRLPEENRHVLSMGMSGDFEVAIEEGSTMVRLGTILFGERTP